MTQSTQEHAAAVQAHVDAFEAAGFLVTRDIRNALPANLRAKFDAFHEVTHREQERLALEVAMLRQTIGEVHCILSPELSDEFDFEGHS